MINERRPLAERGVAWLALGLGIALGIGLGLIYAWGIDPVVERNTAPWQLGPKAREDYVIAVALSYAHNNDLQLAFDRLRALRPDTDVWTMVAEIACERHKTVRIERNSDVLVMRALERLYQPQGASGCADGQYPTPAPLTLVLPSPTISPTPTATRLPTKTATPPLPTDTPYVIEQPSATPLPSGGYVLARNEPFCNPDLDGVIEVRVFGVNGQGVPGVPVQVTWGGNKTDRFFTGLKPGLEPGYADFEMTADLSYSVSLPNLISDPPVVDAVACGTDEEGDPVLTSYRINFQQRSN